MTESFDTKINKKFRLFLAKKTETQNRFIANDVLQDLQVAIVIIYIVVAVLLHMYIAGAAELDPRQN